MPSSISYCAETRSSAFMEVVVRISAFLSKVRQFLTLTTIVLAGAAYTFGQSPITIDTSNPAAWIISNGVLTVRWLPGDGRVNSIHWSAAPNVELIDPTNTTRLGPKGFYMDNAGNISGALTSNYYLDPSGNYIDFYVTHAADTSSGFTWTWHDVMFANDPGIHVYFTLDHGPGNIAASVGQVQWVFRGDLSQFTNTYAVNTGLSNLGATSVPLP